MRAALYLRVLTDDQTTANQQRELEAAAERAGWDVVAKFEDAGISGANDRDQRPAFDKLHCAVARCEIDVVAAWSVDRLGRSLQDLVSFLGELRAFGIDLPASAGRRYHHAGRPVFQMMRVFAEFERAIIVEGARRHRSRPRPGQAPRLPARRSRCRGSDPRCARRRPAHEGDRSRAWRWRLDGAADQGRRVSAPPGGHPQKLGP